MHLFDREVTLEERPILEKYLHSYRYRTSGLSFTSLYMWREANRISWQIFGDYALAAAFSNLENDDDPFMFPPLTGNGGYEKKGLRNAIMDAKDIFLSKGLPFSIRLLPEHMVKVVEEACPGEFTFLEDRPNFDYIYLAKDLALLAGRKYRSKRNHLNFFRENYEYEYISFSSDMAEDAMLFIREFNKRKKESGLSAYELELLHLEELAMEDAFRNIERVGYMSGVIKIGGKIEALCIAGRLDEDTITIHVEKANVAYRGAYQAINNEFSSRSANIVKYINREEDMGLPGLREAKLSYRPVLMLKKYIAAPVI